MTKPISPKDINKTKTIPDFVIKSFNELIEKNFDGDSAHFIQDKVIEVILSKHWGKKYANVTKKREYIYEMKWLDVESIYRAKGWKVEYDSPAYNETYPASFEFTPKGRR